jgi:hypothetical protein
MGRWLVAFIALAVPAAAAGQNTVLGSGTGLPLPSIGLPLPSLGLPHPATGLPQPEPPAPRRGGQPPGDRSTRGHRGDGGAAPYPLFVYPFLLWPPAMPAAPGPAVAAAAPTTGRVIVDAQPAATAQLYIDGFYVGMPGDYPEGIELSAGPHALEVRAPGADSISTSIRIPAGRSISYRASLPPAAASSAILPAAAPAGPVGLTTVSGDARPAPTTFYIIAGCYVGNVAPADAGLPAGCDPAKAIVVRP